jgi:hypothetical protein
MFQYISAVICEISELEPMIVFGKTDIDELELIDYGVECIGMNKYEITNDETKRHVLENTNFKYMYEMYIDKDVIIIYSNYKIDELGEKNSMIIKRSMRIGNRFKEPETILSINKPDSNRKIGFAVGATAILIAALAIVLSKKAN